MQLRLIMILISMIPMYYMLSVYSSYEEAGIQDACFFLSSFLSRNLIYVMINIWLFDEKCTVFLIIPNVEDT